MTFEFFLLQRETFFRLYSYYCQNIPRSERLRETLVDTHLFLQACQLRLGHKLPLAAYLLKPVQRITKYQLLLKVRIRSFYYLPYLMCLVLSNVTLSRSNLLGMRLQQHWGYLVNLWKRIILNICRYIDAVTILPPTIEKEVFTQ